VQNLAVVDVLHSEAHLSEPVENDILRKVFHFPDTLACLLLLFHFISKIAVVCKVHDDAELTCFSLVHFLEANDVGVVKHFKDLGLPIGGSLFFLAQLLNVNLLDHGERLQKDLGLGMNRTI